MRALDAQGVGPQQMNMVVVRRFAQRTGVLGIDPAGQNQGGIAADAPDQLQRGQLLFLRQGNDHQIGLDLGQIAQGAHHLGIHKGEGAGKPLGLEQAVQGLGIGGLRIRRFRITGQNNDRLRGEQGGQVMLVHTAF